MGVSGAENRGNSVSRDSESIGAIRSGWGDRGIGHLGFGLSGERDRICVENGWIRWLGGRVGVSGTQSRGNGVCRDSESIVAIRRRRHVRNLRLHRRPLDSGVLLV